MSSSSNSRKSGTPKPDARRHLVPSSPEHHGTALRRAGPADAAAIARVHLAAFKATYAFGLAHSDEEVHRWVRDTLLPTTETWVAEVDGDVVAFLSLGDGWIEQLYVAPGHTGRGIGSRLVALAKERQPAGLQLWTFQVNVGARRFYERHGFTAVEMTDGAGNDERQPDVRYAWK
jgi:GNAT superfamily N-acetyltransferase